MSSRFLRAENRVARWLCLAVLLSLFLAYLAHLRPEGHFGSFHDDTIFFASARALAQGQGYRLPSLPGPALRPRYPILYPWLLSWVWKWNPSFPANVSGGVWITALFGCWFLVATFVLLRRMDGIGDWAALALTALCAFQAHFLYLSGVMMSDVPFAALAMTAALFADAAIERSSGWAMVAAAGIFAGLSMLTRAVGPAVLAAVLAMALYRRAYRQGAVLGAVALAVAVAGRLLTLPPAGAPGSLAQDSALCGEAYRRTWLYYVDYLGFWELKVPDLRVFGSMLLANLKAFLEAPASHCLFPPLGADSMAGTAFCITLTVGILAGLVRQGRSGGWKTIHFLFLILTAVVCGWNHDLMGRYLIGRYLIMFLPLWYLGLWVEGRHLASMLLRTFRRSRASWERGLAAAMGLGIVAIGALAAREYVFGMRPDLRQQSDLRSALELDKRHVYDWIRENTSPTDRFVSYEDVSLYLYTGRQAIWPLVFRSAGLYGQNPQWLEQDLGRMTEVARCIGARYWVITEDDFPLTAAAGPRIEKRLTEITSPLMLAFRSPQHRVRVYDLACLHHSDRPECRAPGPLLPGGGPDGALGPPPRLERH